MPNNLIREQQLQSVASAAQSFSLDTQDNTLSIVIEALATAASLPSSVILAKTTPTLSIGSWTKNDTTYTTTITYDGDGELTTTLGTISNGTLSITDADGIFSGTIIASEGDTYAATSLNFDYNTESSGGTGKTVPTLTVADFQAGMLTPKNYYALVTYDGDGIISVGATGNINMQLGTSFTGNQVNVYQGVGQEGHAEKAGEVTVTVTASATDTCESVTVTKTFNWEV